MTRIPGYRLLREIASGASGTVHLALQQNLGRTVALKILQPGLFGAEETKARFLREAQMQARLRHANLVELYDAGFAGSQPYLATEFIEGQTLRDLLQQNGALPLAEVARIGGEIAAGLAHAHQAGIVHRDLKPENVLIGSDGRVKVADFGLAKPQTGSGTLQTSAGLLVGTPGYLAPEVLEGQPAKAASDIYALGVVLFEMACGHRPFDRSDWSGMFQAQLAGQTPPLSRERPEAPEALDEVVSDCLQREPLARPPGAAGVAARLAEIPAEALAENDSRRRQPTPAAASHTRVQLSRPSPAIPTRRIPGSPAGGSTARHLAVAVAVLGVALAAAILSLRPGGRTATAFPSIDGLVVKTGPTTASIEWKLSPSEPLFLEYSEERAAGPSEDWIRAQPAEAVCADCWTAGLSGLKPDMTYRFRFARPDGSRSLPQPLQTAREPAVQALQVAYETGARVTVTASLDAAVALSLGKAASPGAKLARQHRLTVDGVDALLGMDLLTAVARYPSGETRRVKLGRIAPVTELLSQSIRPAELAGFIEQTETALRVARGRQEIEQRVRAGVRTQPWSAPLAAFKPLARRFFANRDRPAGGRAAMYHTLLSLEHVDRLVECFGAPGPLEVTPMYEDLVRQVYGEEQMPRPAAHGFQRYETGMASFLLSDLTEKEAARLDGFSNRARQRCEFEFKFNGSRPRELRRAALYAVVGNMSGRLFFEAKLNGKLRLFFRDPLRPRPNAGWEHVYVYFPLELLEWPANRVTVELHALPGTDPPPGASLLEFGIKAE